MSTMKSTKSTKPLVLDVLFLSLIGLAFFLYFVVYLTPSRTAWYIEMNKQLNIIIRSIKEFGP